MNTVSTDLQQIRSYIGKLINKVYGIKQSDVKLVDGLLTAYDEMIGIPKHNVSDEALMRVAFDVFSAIVKDHHKKCVVEIKKLFGIDILKYLNGFIIAKRLNAKNAFGTLYFIYQPSYFKPNTKDRFAYRHILKIQNSRLDEPGLKYEAFMQKRFAKCGLAPKILYDYHMVLHGKKLGIIIMEKYSGNTIPQILERNTLSSNELNQVYTTLIRMLELMCKHNLIHGDLHWDNIGVIEDPTARPLRFRYSLLDFGQSSVGKCDLRVELLQLLRTLRMFSFKQGNIRYLEDKLYAYYMNRFKHDKLHKTPNGNYGYIATHRRAWDAYMDNVYMRNAVKYG